MEDGVLAQVPDRTTDHAHLHATPNSAPVQLGI
jgi:hypothetical protein